MGSIGAGGSAGLLRGHQDASPMNFIQNSFRNPFDSPKSYSNSARNSLEIASKPLVSSIFKHFHEVLRPFNGNL